MCSTLFCHFKTFQSLSWQNESKMCKNWSKPTPIFDYCIFHQIRSTNKVNHFRHRFAEPRKSELNISSKHKVCCFQNQSDMA